MKQSIVNPSKLLPESAEDFVNIERPTFTKCYTCGQPFTRVNVFTTLGWRETQISGMCEACFDELFKE